MKKSIAVIMSFLLILSLVGCSSSNLSSENNIEALYAKSNENSTEVIVSDVDVPGDTVKKDKNNDNKSKDVSKQQKTTECTTESKSETFKVTEKPTECSTESATEAPPVTECSTELQSIDECTTESPPTTECSTEALPTTEIPTEETTEAPKTSVSYSPQNVVSMATSRCISGGMIKTTDNLNNLLANGSITQEEYDEYYPYDGLGYYSVFVETDLNKSATTSGRLLGSEQEIANYIADMLLLESSPYFLIEYAGVTSGSSSDFYEFRCYR